MLRVLHVVFSPSAASELRIALKRLGREDKVVALFDDYRFGPITPLDPAAREAWIGNELGWDMEGFVPHWHEEFWSNALSNDVYRVVWTSRRRANERIGYLAWVARIGEAPVDVVDLTNVKLAKPIYGLGAEMTSYAILSVMPASQILSERLMENARPLTFEERVSAREEWSRLAVENAPLRIAQDLEVISAPITFFDEHLLSFAAVIWRKMAGVIGEALASSYEGRSYDVSDIVLASRVRSLIDEGRLEVRGDPYEMGRCEVRLPQN